MRKQTTVVVVVFVVVVVPFSFFFSVFSLIMNHSQHPNTNFSQIDLQWTRWRSGSTSSKLRSKPVRIRVRGTHDDDDDDEKEEESKRTFLRRGVTFILSDDFWID